MIELGGWRSESQGSSGVAKVMGGGLSCVVPAPGLLLVCMAEYKVKFEVFEGPLDLLLYLIKKDEVDIYEVNLTRLAGQFIEYIETMRLLDLEIAGEFLVMAATLMYIKSRELLPAATSVLGSLTLELMSSCLTMWDQPFCFHPAFSSPKHPLGSLLS